MLELIFQNGVVGADVFNAKIDRLSNVIQRTGIRTNSHCKFDLRHQTDCQHRRRSKVIRLAPKVKTVYKLRVDFFECFHSYCTFNFAINARVVNAAGSVSSCSSLVVSSPRSSNKGLWVFASYKKKSRLISGCSNIQKHVGRVPGHNSIHAARIRSRCSCHIERIWSSSLKPG